MVFVISAPSGSGKTTLINRLLETETNLMFSVSTTTRHKRHDEVDGIDYHFVSREEFFDMMERDEFLEWAEVYGQYYGTTKKEVDRIQKNGLIPLFDVDIQGSRNLREKLDNGIFIFIVPPSHSELKKRLIGRRTESEEQLNIRLMHAGREIAEYVNFDYVIINSDIETSYSKLKSIIVAEKCRKENIQASVNCIMEDFNDYTT